MITEELVVIDGVHTRALHVGGDGPPILLLHGFSDSADCWRGVLEALGLASRRAVAVDLPGSGEADPLPREGVLATLSSFTDALVADHAGAILAGNSLGGLLALRAAENEDTPLLAIAPIPPAGLAYHPRARLIEGGSMRDLRRFGRIARQLADDSRADPLRLDRIRVPVLLLWGAHDRVCDVAGARALLDVVPDSRLVVLDGCGHCPQTQRPDAVAELLATVAVYSGSPRSPSV